MPWVAENFFNRLKACFLILLHGYTWKYAFVWLASLKYGHSAVSEKFPWINFRAVNWLEAYLKPDMNVFEYGSGGSTIFIAKRAGKIVSVEHSREWYLRIKGLLAAEGVVNCELLLREPEIIPSGQDIPYGKDSYTSTALPGLSFEKYVKSIDDYPEGSFDLVFIDGRARASCIRHALKKVRSGGYIMLDDSLRSIYDDALSLLSNYKRDDLKGFFPGETNKVNQASVWKIDKNES